MTYTMFSILFGYESDLLPILEGFPDFSSNDFQYELTSFRANRKPAGTPLMIMPGSQLVREIAGGYLAYIRKDESLEMSKDSSVLLPRLDLVSTQYSIKLDSMQIMLCPGTINAQDTWHLIFADDRLQNIADCIHAHIAANDRKVPHSVYDLEACLVPFNKSVYGK